MRSLLEELTEYGSQTPTLSAQLHSNELSSCIECASHVDVAKAFFFVMCRRVDADDCAYRRLSGIIRALFVALCLHTHIDGRTGQMSSQARPEPILKGDLRLAKAFREALAERNHDVLVALTSLAQRLVESALLMEGLTKPAPGRKSAVPQEHLGHVFRDLARLAYVAGKPDSLSVAVLAEIGCRFGRARQLTLEVHACSQFLREPTAGKMRKVVLTAPCAIALRRSLLPSGHTLDSDDVWTSSILGQMMRDSATRSEIRTLVEESQRFLRDAMDPVLPSESRDLLCLLSRNFDGRLSLLGDRGRRPHNGSR